MTNDKTRKIVGYDEAGKALWVKYVNQDYWFHDSFDDLLCVRMKLKVTDETIKQLEAHREQASVIIDFLWDLEHLCKNEPDHNLIVRAWLDTGLKPKLVKSFCEMARKHEVTGAGFKQTLSTYTGDLNAVRWPIKQTADAHDSLIDEVLAANADKLAGDPEKVANFLVGQVMKKVPDRKAVDVSKIKSRLVEKIGAAGGNRTS